jgi:Zn-dependent peptidase ImmA (M78 family)
MTNERRFQTHEQRAASLRVHAQDMLKAHDLTAAPIDLHRLVEDRSQIRVAAMDLRGACDGLLRWVPRYRLFYLYYDPNPYKKRFNLGHEIAHFLIDEHHHAIRSGGGFHKSNKQSFVGHKRMESEANAYCAELLMPGFLFKDLDVEPCADDILQVAGDFEVSLQSAARRIIERTEIPSALVVSRDGIVSWGMVNDPLVHLGFWGVTAGKTVPQTCATRRAASTGNNESATSHAGQWLEQAPYRLPMREEAIASPGHRVTITMLSVV